LSTDVNPPLEHVENSAPQIDLQKYQCEIEMLNARIDELETLLDKSGADTAPPIAEPVSGWERAATSSAPLLYEKEQIGYVFRDNNLTSLASISATIPESENRLTTQLIASGEVIGEMQVHPSHAITAEEENLASAVAQQVSLQIQNLRLLSAAERARAEALDATRQFTHQSWESFWMEFATANASDMPTIKVQWKYLWKPRLHNMITRKP